MKFKLGDKVKCVDFSRNFSDWGPGGIPFGDHHELKFLHETLTVERFSFGGESESCYLVFKEIPRWVFNPERFKLVTKKCLCNTLIDKIHLDWCPTKEL